MATEIKTRTQVSAGGVMYRRDTGGIWVALISVGVNNRWQLPKGMVSEGESFEQAALREVREETGMTGDLIDTVSTIEYWYHAHSVPNTRFHKFVHFFLLRYVSGIPSDHDDEVNEARWFEIDEGIETLAFQSEKQVLTTARELILAL